MKKEALCRASVQIAMKVHMYLNTILLTLWVLMRRRTLLRVVCPNKVPLVVPLWSLLRIQESFCKGVVFDF